MAGWQRENKRIKEIERQKEKQLQAEKEAHECYRCRWAKWDEKLVFCLFPNCLKDILVLQESPDLGKCRRSTGHLR